MTTGDNTGLLEQALEQPFGPDALSVEFEHSPLPRMPQPVPWWRREPGAEDPVDHAALDWVDHGYILDVGCSTGRHLETRAARGVPGHGIDVSPASIALAKQAGVSCCEADVFAYTPPHPVDVVLAVGGNGGMAGSLAAFPGFLSRLASWLTADGRIVLTVSGWSRFPPGRLHLDAAPGYPGDVRMRFRLGARTGPWFP
ncbi:methyltransferase family protein [Amycolatopsis sulphurea]|uniref:Methyltransferase family protein n=1 Tax=Amycolatopsis sulphurea TaxID=76022 RepID=A0A2A9FGD4_9PSEU|nr:class I SAM-dependent methyltransferase [Amycolatopsis sulphurea]PFG50517.1 methyltransferase family protein [Amycolatopsis sulphurea]